MEYIDYTRFVLAFLLVIGLIGLSAVALRKYTGPKSRVHAGDAPRMEVMETLSLDPRHRLMLVRRDGVEHLLINGPQGVQPLEVGIKETSGESRSEPSFISAPTTKPKPKTAARPKRAKRQKSNG